MLSLSLSSLMDPCQVLKPYLVRLWVVVSMGDGRKFLLNPTKKAGHMNTQARVSSLSHV